MAKIEIKENLIYNVIKAIGEFLFPVITLPYVARVLNADGLGIIQFYNSIISYIILFVSLGIPLYAVRTIAGIKDCIEDLNKNFVEIFVLQLIFVVIGCIIAIILAHNVTRIQTDLTIYLILGLNILFVPLSSLWFFQGIEDFKYIAIRSLIVKTACVILVFSFVKDSSDIYVYAICLVLINLGNLVLNFKRLGNYLHFSIIKQLDIDLCRHLNPTLRIFILNMSTSLYGYLNPILLGFIANETAVGYYATASQYTMLVLGITSVISTVLIPRLSYLFKKEKKDEFDKLGKTIFGFILMFVVPLSFYVCIMAKQIILILCGYGFIPSILVMRLISPVILFIGVTGTLGIQFLFPQGKEKIVIISTLMGAMMNIILNIFLVPFWGEVGTAISTTCTEFAVLCVQLLLGHRYFPKGIFNKQNANYFYGSIIMSISMLFVLKMLHNIYQELVLCSLVGLIVYVAFLVLKKDKNLALITNNISIINKKK